MADKQKIEQLEQQLQESQASVDAEVATRKEEKEMIAELVNALHDKEVDQQEHQTKLAELEERCKIRENFNEEQLLQALEEAKTIIKRLENECDYLYEQVIKMENLGTLRGRRVVGRGRIEQARRVYICPAGRAAPNQEEVA